MPETCLMEILDLPEDSLARVFKKVSTRSLIRLVSAYPRAAGRSFMSILAQSFSRPTLEFFREELQAADIPSYAQIRSAEQELMKIIQEEHRELDAEETYRL